MIRRREKQLLQKMQEFNMRSRNFAIIDQQNLSTLNVGSYMRTTERAFYFKAKDAKSRP